MSQRIPGLSRRLQPVVVGNKPAAVTPADIHVEQLLTPALVDDAVDKVLDGLSDDVARKFVDAWANDETSEPARMLQTAMVAKHNQFVTYANAIREVVRIKYVLTDDEQRRLSARYPDADIKFFPTVRHDHALAASDRLLSSIKLRASVPAGLKYVDFGGSVLQHVERGNRQVKVVGGLHDSKDKARASLVKLRLRMLSRDESSSEDTRFMANSILEGKTEFFEEGSLETYVGSEKVGVMSHVYDVPLEEIAMMMSRNKMAVFDGVVHFSDRFFFEDEGVMPDVGARFQKRDGQFLMGFLDSPSHWYRHTWSQFIKYGCDQIVYADGKAFSYKIVSKRGDTICFRVLPLRCAAPGGDSYAVRPGVPVVSVSTWEHSGYVDRADGVLSRATRFYPQDIWNSMVSSANRDITTNNFDFNSHINEYKALVAGHKYNGVSTVTGVVDASNVPWLAVDSAVYAMTQLALLRRTTRGFVAAEQERRSLASSGVLMLTLKSVAKTLKIILAYTSSWLIRWIDSLVDETGECLDRLIEVSSMAKVIKLDGGVIAAGGSAKHQVVFDEFPLRSDLHRQMMMDNYIKMMKQKFEEASSGDAVADRPEVIIGGRAIPFDGKELRSDSVAPGSTTAVQTMSEVLDKPDWVPVVNDGVIKEEYRYDSEFHNPQQMRDAVSETVISVNAEAAQLEAFCSGVFSKFASGRRVDAELVRSQRETYRNMDFWQVNEGVIQHSVLGTRDAEFDFAGVYCPVPVHIPGTGRVPDAVTRLVPVEESAFKDKVYNVIPTGYTGLVLTVDGLKVLNGPHIAAGLETVAKGDYEVEIAGMVGGPGCGKSTAILKNFRRGDMIVTPLKLSCLELRRKLVEQGTLNPAAANKVVRTCDSILVAAGKDNASSFIAQVHTVHIDECFNTNAGRIYATLEMLKAKRCMMYGDKNQIEHVVRASMSLVYPAVRFPHVVQRYTVFRSCPEILACFSGHYGDKLRTARKEKGAVSLVQGEMPEIDKGDDVLLLVMNQASKTTLHKKYPKLKSKVFTVHESQGSEADSVYLFNFETRPMSAENHTYLYNQDRYVNVAISRAKHKFVYFVSSHNKDLVQKWIERGSSPSLISGLSDLSTAGEMVSI